MNKKRYIQNELDCEYRIYGNGKRILYCFHGFGGDSSDWDVFGEILSKDFSVFSFSDFFHGDTYFPESRIENDPLQKSELAEFFRGFAEENNHQSVSIMAYSSGARIALTLIEKKAFSIENVYLLAPDGIRLSFWNSAFCKLKLIRHIYKKLISKPDFFFKIVLTLLNLKLIDKNLGQFVLFSMRSKEKRQKVYSYWMVYRKILPDKKSLKQAINTEIDELNIIVGKNDSVIPAKNAYNFVKGLSVEYKIHEWDAGHYLIHEKYKEELKKIMA